MGTLGLMCATYSEPEVRVPSRARTTPRKCGVHACQAPSRSPRRGCAAQEVSSRASSWRSAWLPIYVRLAPPDRSRWAQGLLGEALQALAGVVGAVVVGVGAAVVALAAAVIVQQARLGRAGGEDRLHVASWKWPRLAV